MNDRDWFRKRMKHRRPGCVLGLPLGAVAALLGSGYPGDPRPAERTVSSSRYILFSAVAGLVLASDQLSKWIIVQYVGARDELQVIPGFMSIVHAKNPGAAFSFMDESEYRMYIFAAFTAVAIGVLLHTLRELGEGERLQVVAVGLLMGGALGNAIDRLLYQEVTDFIRVYTEWPPIADRLAGWFGTSTWPIFNVADSAIVVGVGLFLIHFLLFEGRKTEVDLPGASEPT